MELYDQEGLEREEGVGALYSSHTVTNIRENNYYFTSKRNAGAE